MSVLWVYYECVVSVLGVWSADFCECLAVSRVS